MEGERELHELLYSIGTGGPSVHHSRAERLSIESESTSSSDKFRETLLKWARDGFASLVTVPPEKRANITVAIVGAGASGFCAAHEISAAGFRVEVIESTHRVGGRAHTLRSPPFSENLFAEAGAMRFPPAHYLVWWYVLKFGVRTNPFINGLVSDDRFYLFPALGEPDRSNKAYLEFRKAMKFGENETLWSRARGIKTMKDWKWWTFYDLHEDPDDMWVRDCKPIIAFLEKHPSNGWDAVTKSYDRFSLLTWLQAEIRSDDESIPLFAKRPWTSKEVSFYLLTSLQEMFENEGWIEAFKEYAGGFWNDKSSATVVGPNESRIQVGLVEMTGGTDTFTTAFSHHASKELVRWHFGHTLTHLDWSGKKSICHTKTDAGESKIEADFVILACPFLSLRHVSFSPSFEPEKQRAIREIGFASSTKIVLQYANAFWDKDPTKPEGGASLMDLPNRNLYYPSHTYGRGDNRSVLLASYTWTQEATTWGALPEHERIRLAHKGVVAVHGEVANQNFELGASFVWAHNPYTGGAAFPYFPPGQWTSLFPHIVAPVPSSSMEHARIFFSGDHCSQTHGWIQGALESSWFAMKQLSVTINSRH